VRAFVAIAALLVLAGAGAALWIRAEGEAPSLETPESMLIGRAGGALAISLADARSGLRSLSVELVDGDSVRSLLQEEYTKPLPYEFIKIGLTRERKELYGIIDERVDAMVKACLIEEVERILGMNPGRTPLQAIGYKEFASYIHGEINLEEAVRLVKRNTRRYAKRQFTWFSKEQGIVWIDVTGVHASEEIFRLLLKALE